MRIRRKNVTPKQKQEVLDLFEAGLSAEDVSKAVQLSLSEVYKIRREEIRAKEIKAQTQTYSEGLRRHGDDLLAVLNDLQGIEVFPLRDHDIQTWWTRPEEPSWPVAKGRVYRNKDGSLSVCLSAEDLQEWEYLQGHLEGDPVWAAIEAFKEAFAADVSARLSLLKRISERVTRPTEEGGLGLPISAELGFVAVTQPEVTTYYVFTIYDQVLSRTVGLRLMPKTRREFDYREPGYPSVLYLGGTPVIRSPDPSQRSQAINFLLGAQEGLLSLPEAKAAVAAYHEAEAKTTEFKRCLRRILLAPGLPPGSVCEGCRDWLR